MIIDSSLAGGNIVVKQIDGGNVTLTRALRDTPHHWIYWKFRAVFDSVVPVHFRFDDGYALTSRGPAISLDHGKSWNWGAAEFDLTVNADSARHLGAALAHTIRKLLNTNK